jgi:hypothetical protein
MPKVAGIRFSVRGNARPVPTAELERCERLLGATFPACYREFITQVGAGYFADIPIRAFEPRRVLATTPGDQDRLRQYWFWDESAAVLPQDRGVTSIQCFDTDVGHDLRFVPSDASRFYFLSRHEGLIVACRELSDVLPLVGVGAFRRLRSFTFHPWPPEEEAGPSSPPSQPR